jgi:hypothetical protein
MAEQLQGFSFEAAECELPADRLEILGAIKALARREGLVPRDASTRVGPKKNIDVLVWMKSSMAFLFTRNTQI